MTYLISSLRLIMTLKKGVEEDPRHDNNIHGTHTLYVCMTLVFNALLLHRFSSNSLILGTMVPIPKNKENSLCNSSNYRAIALSNVIGKTLDCVILIKERHVLTSSNLQFGFINGLSQPNPHVV